MSTSEYHDEEDPPFSYSHPPAPPDPTQDKKRNRLTKVLSGHFKREVNKDKLTSEYDISAIDEEEFQTFAKKAFAMYDENRDGVLDEMEMNKLLRDAYTMGGKNLALKQANVKQAEKTKRWKRNTVGVIVILMLAVAVIIVQTFFLNESNVRDGSETREEVKRTKVLEVSPSDEAGYGHLQDVSGSDLSVHSHGDKFTATSIVDPITGDVVECMETGEVAMMTAGVENGASVRLNYQDPVTGVTSDSFTVSDGDFHDKYDHLAFHDGKVKILFNSNRCNVLLSKSPPSPLLDEVVEDTVQNEELSNEEVDTEEVEKKGVDYTLDVEPALQDALDKAQEGKKNVSTTRSKGLFGRFLRDHFAGVSPQGGGAGVVSHQSEDAKAVTVKDPPVANPSSRVRVVGKSKGYHHHQSIRAGITGMTDIGLRNREIYMAHRASIQSTGRRMETDNTDYVETCSEDNCQSPFPVLATEGYGSVIENGACVSEGNRLSYNNIVNNNPTEGPDGIEMDCANYCSSYSGVDGYVGFSLRFKGTANLGSYPIGRCQCQFKEGTTRPDTSGSTSNWWGSSASGHVDLAMGNGNNDYVCYPWSDAIPTSPPTSSPTKEPSVSPTSSPTIRTSLPTSSPTKEPSLSPTSSPTLSLCTNAQGYSNGSTGNLTLDASGTLSLNGNPIASDSRFFDSTTLGTAPDAVTAFENIDTFFIAANQVANVLGTMIVYAKRIQIDGELNGTGGGFSGAVASTTATGAWALPGESPPDTNGHGQGGMGRTGGGGGSHAGRGGRGGDQCCNEGGNSGAKYDDTLPLTLRPGSGGGGGAGAGSPGGAGGAGGAAMIFYSEEIAINGNIYADGVDGGRGDNDNGYLLGGGGGGSGGSIRFSACTLTAGSSAKIEAKGGNGGQARSYGYGGGGGGGGVFAYEASTVNYDGSMTIIVDGGARGEEECQTSQSYCDQNPNRVGFAGSAGKVFLLPSNLEVEDSCDHPTYLDSSTPLDKNSRCASGFCRTLDNKCGCTIDDHCLSSSEVCHTDNKCYVSGLYGQDCSVDDGTALNARCLSNKCRSSDNLCGCTIDDHCLSSSEVCHTDNKCYSSGLIYDQDCSVEDGSVLNDRCLSNKCRSSDNLCGCTIDDHCLSPGQVCHTDNKCYSSELTYEDQQGCAADNGDNVDARCISNKCRSSDNKCGCTDNSHCPSNNSNYRSSFACDPCLSSSEVCHDDNKCYSSGLIYNQDCSVEDGSVLNDRCDTGLCRSSDNKCGCTDNSHCLFLTHICHLGNNKCYTSGLSIGQSCTADNGDNVDARCTSGKCRSTCVECLNSSHCPSDKVCETSTNTCVTQKYRFSVDCDFGSNINHSDEETTSQVSLNVKRSGWTQVWISEMDKTSGNCPDHTFELAGAEPDEYVIKNHGSDELGVDYIKLEDATNGGELRRWGANGDQGWCLSNDANAYCFPGLAQYPRQGIRLHIDGSVDPIKFSGGTSCATHSDAVCSSGSCVIGGGSCGIWKTCCAPG